MKDNIARVSAEIILDLGKIIRLGQGHKFQVILLEIPVFCTKEWNKLHGHRTPNDFDEQDQRLFQDIKLVNEEIQRLNLDSGKVSPMFNADLKLKRNRITPNRSYFNFSQFTDGIHPNPLLSCYWLRRIVELVRAECYLIIQTLCARIVLTTIIGYNLKGKKHKKKSKSKLNFVKCHLLSKMCARIVLTTY